MFLTADIALLGADDTVFCRIIDQNIRSTTMLYTRTKSFREVYAGCLCNYTPRAEGQRLLLGHLAMTTHLHCITVNFPNLDSRPNWVVQHTTIVT